MPSASDANLNARGKRSATAASAARSQPAGVPRTIKTTHAPLKLLIRLDFQHRPTFNTPNCGQ
jgi:hypothetical protein